MAASAKNPAGRSVPASTSWLPHRTRLEPGKPPLSGVLGLVASTAWTPGTPFHSVGRNRPPRRCFRPTERHGAARRPGGGGSDGSERAAALDLHKSRSRRRSGLRRETVAGSEKVRTCPTFLRPSEAWARTILTETSRVAAPSLQPNGSSRNSHANTLLGQHRVVDGGRLQGRQLAAVYLASLQRGGGAGAPGRSGPQATPTVAAPGSPEK